MKGIGTHVYKFLENKNELDMRPEDYTMYIDSSEIVKNQYLEEGSAGLERNFFNIEDWLKTETSPEENVPLIIESEDKSDAMRQIVNWIKWHNKHDKKKCQDTILTHYASIGGNNSNYFYAFYTILIKLREKQNIKQKVELVEEKLRKNFLYWLDVCSRKVIKNTVYDGNIIIILEGVENFIDFDTRKESSIKFWLPKTFPNRIKVIVTCEPKSRSNEHFDNLGCRFIKLKRNTKDIVKYIDSVKERPWVNKDHKNRVVNVLESKILFSEVDKNHPMEAISTVQSKDRSGSVEINIEELKSLSNNDIQIENYEVDKRVYCCSVKKLLIKAISDFLLPVPITYSEFKTNEENFFDEVFENLNYGYIKSLNTRSEFLDYIIVYFEDNFTKKENLEIILSAVSLTHKGLTMEELMSLSGLSVIEIKRIFAVFKVFIRECNGFYSSTDEKFRKSIEKHYYSDIKSRHIFHKKIAASMENTTNSIRKLEEQTYHLYCGMEFFTLKQKISYIENFQLLFNPMNKFDLFRYWQILEQNLHDPVVEYNKGIELFDTYYNPDANDLFLIILQICRFLKEFSDFETMITPDFRHPMIKGKNGMLTVDPDTAILNKGLNKNIRGNNEKSDMSPKSFKSGQGLKKGGKNQKNNPFGNFNQNDRCTNDNSKVNIDNDMISIHNPFYSDDEEVDEICIENEETSAKKQDSNQRFNFGTKYDIDYLKPENYNSPEVFSYLDSIGLLSELKKFTLFDPGDVEILNSWEKANIESGYGYHQFRETFKKIMKKKYETTKNKEIKKEDEDSFGFEIQEDKINNQTEKVGIDIIDIRNKKDDSGNKVKNPFQALIDDIDLEIKPEKPTSFYYYKRWVWIIFPFACMSIDNNLQFSEVIGRCYASATHYMKIEEEKNLYKNALKIAIESKIRKKLMYAKKEPTTRLERSATFVQSYNESHVSRIAEVDNEDSKSKHSELRGPSRQLSKEQSKDSFRKNTQQSANSYSRPNLASSNNFVINKSQKAGLVKISSLQDFSKTGDSFAPGLATSNQLKLGVSAGYSTGTEFYKTKGTSSTNMFKSTQGFNKILKPQTHRNDADKSGGFFLTAANEDNVSMGTSQLDKKFVIGSARSKINMTGRSIHKANKPVIEKNFNSVVISKSKLSIKDLMKRNIKDQVLAVLREPANRNDLSKVDTIVEKYCDKEIKILTEENCALTKELNEVSYQCQTLRTKISHIPLLENFKGAKSNDVMERKYDEEFDHWMCKNKGITKKLKAIMDQKHRLKNIIEVCELNSYDNERWIRSLNTLTDNFDKMINQEGKDKSEIISKIEELEALEKDYVDAFNINIKNKYGFVDHMKHSLENQKFINDMVKNTDHVIKDQMTLQMKNDLHMKELNVAKNEQTRQKFYKERRKLILKEELNHYRELVTKYKVILESGNTRLDESVTDFGKLEEKYNENQKFKDMMQNLEGKLDLEKEIYLLNNKIDGYKEKLSIVEDEMIEIQKYRKIRRFELSVDELKHQQDSSCCGTNRNKDVQGPSIFDLKIELETMHHENKRTKVVYEKRVKQLTELKTGILTISYKNEQMSNETSQENKSPMELSDKIIQKLERLRNYMTNEDFMKLVQGKLDVKKFMKFDVQKYVEVPSFVEIA